MLQKPYKGDENYIFISYSHRDIDEVLAFIETLQENGYNVWYDEGIDPGTEWDENIAKHIRECAYFISFITENYIQSQNCRDELTYARDLNKERLLIYGEDVELPEGMKMRMNRLQAIFKYKYTDSLEFYTKVFETEGLDHCKDGKKGENENAPVKVIKASKKTNKNSIKIIVSLVVITLIAGIIAITQMNNHSSNSSQQASDEINASEQSANNSEKKVRFSFNINNSQNFEVHNLTCYAPKEWEITEVDGDQSVAYPNNSLSDDQVLTGYQVKYVGKAETAEDLQYYFENEGYIPNAFDDIEGTDYSIKSISEGSDSFSGLAMGFVVKGDAFIMLVFSEETTIDMGLAREMILASDFSNYEN